MEYIVVENEITCFEDLLDLCWSGALDRVKGVDEMDEDKKKRFFDYVVENLECCEKITDTMINNFIWFDCDEFLEELENEDKEDEED